MTTETHTKIWTHMRPDLDACASVWAVKKFVAHFGNAEVGFVPGHWDGATMSDKDMAVDIPAGGRGIKGRKGEDGTVHSAFAEIIRTYADETSTAALAEVVAYVDAVDTATATKGVVDFNQVCQGLMTAALAAGQPMPAASATVVAQMEVIFDGLYAAATEKLAATQEADKAQWVEGQVAITQGGMAVTQALYARGAKAVVFVGSNDSGHWMSASRAPDCKVNLGEAVYGNAQSPLKTISSIFEEKGEGVEFFAHPAGFLVGRGSAKAPMETPSKVSPVAFAEAVASAIDYEQNPRCTYCGMPSISQPCESCGY